MIELNLTHKESKKILELGYDFSPVCDRFVQELAKLKEPEYIEQEQFLVTIFRTETNQRMSDSLIPIIPKAALEACLPDFLCVKDFYGELDRSRFVKRLCNGMIDLNSQDSMTVSHDWFNSAYEAFIWCHKNYPEELKAKFNEVMK